MRLDIKGVESARSGLMRMAANPTGRPRSGMCPALIRELYVEIREARIAGRTVEGDRRADKARVRRAVHDGCREQMLPHRRQGMGTTHGCARAAVHREQPQGLQGQTEGGTDGMKFSYGGKIIEAGQGAGSAHFFHRLAIEERRFSSRVSPRASRSAKPSRRRRPTWTPSRRGKGWWWRGE